MQIGRSSSGFLFEIICYLFYISYCHIIDIEWVRLLFDASHDLFYHNNRVEAFAITENHKIIINILVNFKVKL